MAFEKAKAYLTARGYGDRVQEFDVSSATVELAAKAVGTEPGKIAKSLTFKLEEDIIMILCAGDARIDNSKYKKHFGIKAKMPDAAAVEARVGHAVGGVCPFGIPDDLTVYLDESLKRYDVVYPACGSDNSAVELSIPELEEVSRYTAWIDVCKVVIPG